MKRLKLKDLLLNYFPIDQQEIIFKKDMLEFIDAYEDCLKDH